MRDRPAVVKVTEMFEERYGHAMDANSARTFTAALTLFQAINKAGNTDPKAIRGALKSVSHVVILARCL